MSFYLLYIALTALAVGSLLFLRSEHLKYADAKRIHIASGKIEKWKSQQNEFSPRNYSVDWDSRADHRGAR